MNDNQPFTHARDAAQACDALAPRLSRMAHDLRTPLNAIIGFVQILQLEDSFSSDQLDSLMEIDKAAQLLNTRMDIAFAELRAELEAIAHLSQADQKPVT